MSAKCLTLGGAAGKRDSSRIGISGGAPGRAYIHLTNTLQVYDMDPGFARHVVLAENHGNGAVLAIVAAAETILLISMA